LDRVEPTLQERRAIIYAAQNELAVLAESVGAQANGSNRLRQRLQT
jgi:hypothetical protein